ncbi:MAG: hypothetical protein A4E66_02089 [Syntrophus sp. PtaB.Bin001]|nr:MAG: hypothetical protein A4E66_02089 [Syntrophus sp. PtaB.Bin001]
MLFQLYFTLPGLQPYFFPLPEISVFRFQFSDAFLQFDLLTLGVHRFFSHRYSNLRGHFSWKQAGTARLSISSNF